VLRPLARAEGPSGWPRGYEVFVGEAKTLAGRARHRRGLGGPHRRVHRRLRRRLQARRPGRQHAWVPAFRGDERYL